MPLPQPIPLPMSVTAGVTPAPAPVMTLHPLRQAAPPVSAMADAMPETSPMMEAAGAAAPQPVQHPAVEPQARPTASRANLFAEPQRAPGAAEPSRPSLFTAMTGGVFRRQRHAPAMASEPAPVRAEPAMQEPPRVEPPRASVRQTGGDEVGLDIPAFLRRQSS
jgi:cell division protein FtsZ